MKRYPNPLVLATVFCVISTILVLIFYWDRYISIMTWLHSSVEYAILIATIFIAPVATYKLMTQRGVSKTVGILAAIKDVAAILTLCSLLTAAGLYFVLSTLAWALPGDESSYSAPYTYSPGSRHSCSGANVYDPALEKKIRVCYPAGNYYDNRIIVVQKRTNALGTVITGGRTLP